LKKTFLFAIYLKKKRTINSEMSYQQDQAPAYQSAPAPSYQQQPVTTNVAVTDPLIGKVNFAEIPQRHHCQFCQKDIVTEVRFENGMLTYIACGVLVILGCFFGCCLIPFCVDAAKDIVHVCPNCHNAVGKKTRL